MKKDYNKIINDNNLSFLKEHDVIQNLSKSFAKILKNYKPTLDSQQSKIVYSSIREGIIINIENIDQFHDHIDILHSALNDIKHNLFGIDNRHKKFKIKNDKSVIDDGKEQLLQLFNPLKDYSIIILKEIELIETINPNLLCLLFHTDKWGGTLHSTYSLRPKHKVIVKDEKRFLDFSIDRVLGLSTNKIEHLIEHEIGEVESDLCDSLDAEEFYRPVDMPISCYDKINYCIYDSILDNFSRIIKELRDSCRRIIEEIDSVKEDEKFNDPCFRMIIKRCFESFHSDGFDIYNKKVKNDFITLLKLIYDFKRDVEEHGTMQMINSEEDVHKHLEEYLTRVSKEELIITHEGRKARGNLDFQINEICIEIKIDNKGYTSIDDLTKDHMSQLKEYMSDRNNRIGILLGFDQSKQTTPHADRENYFKPIVSKGGRSISMGGDVAPVGIITILIFGGERTQPSNL